MIATLLAVLGGALLLVGLTLLTIGVAGVLRQTATLNQLHAQGLATGPAVIAVLAASIATQDATIITFAVLTSTFVAITSPVASHAIARAGRLRRHRRHPS